MKKIIFLSLLFAIGIATSEAQEKPKLIVGVVVDQMRTDYIFRYWDKLGDDGFKRLISEGYYCKNAHFNYIPTYTGPGHASVYTGTTPMNHGIIANDWYDKQLNEAVYCSQDDTRKSVGTTTDAGQMSPWRMLAPTLGDAVRISTQFRGKSIGISIKDRGAILPAGHSANAAYWLDYETGDFVSSSYYMENLPEWVKAFNKKKYPDALSKDGWQPLLAIERYTESTADDTPYEKVLEEGGRPVFPYNLSKLIKEKGYYPFATSPFGNTILTMLADQAVINEDMGQDEFTDLLAISYSTPDIAGHAFGPQSIEVEDIYLRLDQEIAELLNMLDLRVGKGEYLFFLTADHAAAQVPAYLKDNGIPVGYFNKKDFEAGLKEHLNNELGNGEWILNISNQQIFLNHSIINERNMEDKRVMEEVANFAWSYPGIANVMNTKQLQHPLPDDEFASMARKGWHPSRSGDIVLQYLPGWISYSNQGTTHGSSYNYDSHVPVVFFGKGIKQGISTNHIKITQIAATISLAANIAFPELAERQPVSEALAP